MSALAELHEKLDEAVANAYCWPHNLTDSQILNHVRLLNQERAREEENGTIRWIVPEQGAGMLFFDTEDMENSEAEMSA